MYIVTINNAYLASFNSYEEAKEYMDECDYNDPINYYGIKIE